MKIKALAELNGEKEYIVDENDTESLFAILQQMEQKIGECREAGDRLPEDHPLWAERRLIKEAYYTHPEIEKSFNQAFREAVSFVLKQETPDVHRLCAPPRPIDEDAPFCVEKHSPQ